MIKNTIMGLMLTLAGVLSAVLGHGLGEVAGIITVQASDEAIAGPDAWLCHGSKLSPQGGWHSVGCQWDGGNTEPYPVWVLSTNKRSHRWSR